LPRLASRQTTRSVRYARNPLRVKYVLKIFLVAAFRVTWFDCHGRDLPCECEMSCGLVQEPMGHIERGILEKNRRAGLLAVLDFSLPQLGFTGWQGTGSRRRPGRRSSSGSRDGRCVCCQRILMLISNQQEFPPFPPAEGAIVSEIQVPDRMDVEGLRMRLRKMADGELLRFGRAAKYMCSRYANLAKPPLEPFVIQLREARAEWRRRYPKLPSSGSA